MKSSEKKNFIWNLIGISINSFNSLFFLIIINWFNTKNEAGIFTFAYSLICLTYVISIFYTRIYQIHNLDKYSGREFIISRYISTIISLIFVILFIFVNDYSLYKCWIIILICLFRCIEAISDSYYGILQANNELYKSGISLTVKGIIGLIIFCLIDYIFKNVIFSLLGLILVNLLIFIIYDIINTKKYLRKEYKLINVISIFKIALPIFIFSFISIYLVNCSKYILDYLADAQIQNIYGIILMPATFLSIFSLYILNPFLSKMDDLYKKNNRIELKKIYQKMIYIILFTGIFLTIIYYFIGSPILGFIYHINLKKYIWPMIIIFVGAICYSLINIYSAVLTIYNKNIEQMILYLIVAIIASILAYLFIIKIGIVGAAIVYFTSFTIICLIEKMMIVYFDRKDIK